jgi:putative DNA primase/helicase
MVDEFTLAVATAPKKDSIKWKNEVVTWSDIKGWMGAPANKKEAGNYVLGRLESDGRRNNRTVVARSALTLDVDNPDGDFVYKMQSLTFLHIWHTTYSSTPENPRYRLIIPLDREISPAEYEAAARGVMDQMGMECFDPGSIEYARYMFMPSSQKPSWFEWEEGPGNGIASAEELIALAPESLAGLPPIRPSRWKQSPFEMAGMVGEFNRAYEDLDELIEVYDLPYDKAGDKRWTLRGAIGSAAGVGEVAAGLWYSHHGGDPAHGEAQTAFDLVRIHLFGELDEGVKSTTPVNRKPSHVRMTEVASKDNKVIASMLSSLEEDFGKPDPPPTAPTGQVDSTDPDEDPEEDDEDAPDDWRVKLAFNRAGSVVDSLHNWDLIIHNDQDFQCIVRNEMTNSIEIDRDLSWRAYRSNARSWVETDLQHLKNKIERRYRLKASKERVDEMVTLAAFDRKIDPVVDYLKGLDGRWDGRARVEECLPGVKATTFTRLVARKSMVAAVARAMQPGVKWDHSLILFGDEGLGKSYWVDKMSRGWTANLGDIRNKDTLITMDRTWIVMSDEGHSLKKADADAQKEFLTRTVDIYRAPYDRQVAEHPRRCVIWGSTNDDVFLRRQQGNRRFLIVHCTERVDFDMLTPDYVDQVWAEAYALWQKGERLYLDDTESSAAIEAREPFTEDDSLAGRIEDFLNMPVPEDWSTLGRALRTQHYRDYQDGLAPETEFRPKLTCPVQIWYELLGEMRNPQLADLRLIRESMKNVPGWRRLDKPIWFPGYGTQRSYERFDVDAELEELL